MFLADVAALLQMRADRVRHKDPDFASIDLAAHLLAAATYLRERYGDARMDTSEAPSAVDLEEALEIAKNISRSDPVDAYLQACAALSGIDASFASTLLVDAPSLPEQTVLQPLQDAGRLALFGTVKHWIRPPSPWRVAHAHREAAAPLVNVYPPTPVDRLEVLGMIWDRGEWPEVRPVRRRDLPSSELTSFRIALCPLACGGHPRFVVSPRGNQFTVDAANAHSNPAALAEHLTTLGRQLESAQVQLLVLPELSVTETARRQLAELLIASRHMVGIVSGSFHVWRDDHVSPLNEAVFHIPYGVAWEHHKLGYFRVTPRDIAGLGEFFARPLPELQARVVEGIRRGAVLHFWDTRIGRIATLICADAIAQESMIPAIERCRPDIVLLPSMSTDTDAFERLAENLARRRISVFCVNAATACAGRPKTLAAIVEIALATPRSAPLSRIRWSLSSPPRAYSFAARDWIDVPPDQVQVLENQTGIVIDLDRHLSWYPTSGT